jgi:hypothetical protein
VGDAGPCRQIELWDKQEQCDREGHSAQPRQNVRSPDGDCQQHAADTEEGESKGERGRCRSAEPNRVDQAQEVQRYAGIHFARNGVQSEILSTVVRKCQSSAEPDSHRAEHGQTKASAFLR